LGLINYCGNVKSVRKFIIESDCIILPSYREGLSKSLLEASAVGRPMLVSNVPGCKDIVSDGFNGFLFEPKNSISLSKAIIKFIETPALLKNTMSINAYKNSHKFDEKYIIDKYNKLII